MPNIKTASNNTITGDTRVMQPVRESKTENKSTLTKSRTKTKTFLEFCKKALEANMRRSGRRLLCCFFRYANQYFEKYRKGKSIVD